MSEISTIVAEPRERAGKGAARAARRAGLVPGVIYGAKKDPIAIAFPEKELSREIHTAGFFARLYDVKVGSKKERVLARDVQFHPITDRPVHIDLLRVSASSTVTVAVPCHFVNEELCPGLTKGGVLNVVRHELDLVCRADAIPEEIEIDLSGLDFGEGVHISDITLPEGVEPEITGRDFTICTIAAPVVHTEVTEEEEEDELDQLTTDEGEEEAAEEEGE
ncbi:MAG: 50S ribosomal protein L25/general stress protein Ctc, partial [Kiloniellales bacterium]|nr:50S ribosomal protein L25/general stress protein Ctc [Kiloniellales bacterium]